MIMSDVQVAFKKKGFRNPVHLHKCFGLASDFTSRAAKSEPLFKGLRLTVLQGKLRRRISSSQSGLIYDK